MDVAEGAGRYKPTLPGSFTSNRAPTTHDSATAAAQQRPRSKLWPS